MQQIKISSNKYGKLFPFYFMEVRLHDDEKYFIGNIIEVVLGTNILGTAKIAAVKTFNYGNINDVLSFMNCGEHAAYQASLLQRFYIHEEPMLPDTRLMQIVFHWEQRNMELFEFLLKEWWQKIVDAQPHYLK